MTRVRVGLGSALSQLGGIHLIIRMYLLLNLFSHLAEAIKTNKRATVCKCYCNSWLAERSTHRKVFILFYFL